MTVGADSDGLLVHAGRVLVKGRAKSTVTILDGVITPSVGITLPSGAIPTAALAAHSVSALVGQFINTSSFATATTGSWVTSDITTGSVACVGGLLMVDASVPIAHSAATASVFFGFSIDAAIGHYTALTLGGIGAISSVSFHDAFAVAAGNHTIAVIVFNNTAGTLTVQSSAHSSLRVIELRR